MARIDPNVKKLLKLVERMFKQLRENDLYIELGDYEEEYGKLRKRFVKPAIQVSSGKAKSRVLQNWTARKIGELLGFAWGKDEMIAPREMGQGGVDVRLVADAKEQFPWSVECKNTEQWDLPGFIRQAKENRLPGTDWLVVVKKNRHEEVVVLDAEVFFDLLRLIKGKKGR
jgi:hypothetical protein